ncbi:MAG: ketoacyl-synthetase C-terminal extension domain-containing protein, partial [Bacteroidota bacterium]
GIGEAACAVVLRRLEDAERDHDPVFAVIKGYAMNQDSYRSSSLTSPSSVAQADVLTKAWEAAGISPEHISYLEAHGTGTKLGDPIEIDGISRAFAKYTQRKQFCAISAFKSNIGHTDAAAGLASLIKVIMALRYKKLFPTVHFDEPNNLIPFHESPVYVNSELRDWEPDSGRLVAGLSSFGISGTNCHFVIANAVERTNEAQRQSHTWLFPFSASSANALDLLLKQACDRLRVGSVNPGDLSYTLCCRRTHWEHRAAFVARDSVELVTAITEYRSSRPSVFKDFWFAFSDHIDQSWYSGAISVFKVFNDDISRCIESVGREEHFIGEAFQFSLFRFFEHINCPVSNVTGIGKGRLVANLVKNGKNFSDIVSYQMEDQSINRDRIIEFGKLLYETGTGAIDPSNDQALRRVLKNTTSEAQIIDVGSGDAIEFILRITQQMYLSGRNVKWGTLFSYNHSIVEWPTYPFEKIKCWIREPENPAGEWISTMGWAKADVKLKTLNAQSFIVVCDDEITGAKIVGPLEQRGHKCLLVSSDENRLRATRADLTSRKFVPTGIVYVAVGEGQTNLALSACDKNISRTVLPLFHIASVFSDLLTAIDFNLTAITTNARQVLPGDGVD